MKKIGWLIQTVMSAFLLVAGTQTYAQAYSWKASDIEDARPADSAYAAGDYARSAIIYSALAENGNAVAQYNLGAMYAKGLYGQKNPLEAVRWYLLAAEQKYADAQYELGILYRAGTQLPQNYPKAWQLFKMAADQGHTQAMVQLASMYMQGTGVLKDESQATYWYRIAAERGNSSAQRSLSTAYALGIGVAADPVLSYMWLVLALSQAENAEKQKELTEQIDLASRNMTAAQIEEAHTLALKCNSHRPYRC